MTFDAPAPIAACPAGVVPADWRCLRAIGVQVDQGGAAQPLDLLGFSPVDAGEWTTLISFKMASNEGAAIIAIGYEVLGGDQSTWRFRVRLNADLLSKRRVWWADGVTGFRPGGINPVDWCSIEHAPLPLRPNDEITLEAHTTTAGNCAARLVGRLYLTPC